MTTRPRPFRAWCALAWRWVLEATQAMAGHDPTGPYAVSTPPYPVVPVGWVYCTQWALEPRTVLPEATRQAVTERLRVFTPPEEASLRVASARYQANCPPFTARELRHLHFVRWLHETGRVVG
jgi:hypothetical protein